MNFNDDSQNWKIILALIVSAGLAAVYMIFKFLSSLSRRKKGSVSDSSLQAGPHDEEAQMNTSISGQEDLDGTNRFYFPIKKGDSYAVASVKSSDGSDYKIDFVADDLKATMASFSFSTDEPRTAYLQGDEIHLINIKTGENLVLKKESCHRLKISPNGRLFATLTSEQKPIISIRAIDENEAAVFVTVDPSTNPFSETQEVVVNDFDFTYDTKFIYYSVSAADDSHHFLTKFDLESQEIVNIMKIKDRATCISISPDDTKLAFMMKSSTVLSVNVFNLLDYDASIQIQTGNGNMEMGTEFLRWTEDGGRIFNYGKNSELFLINFVDDGMIIKTVKCHDSSNIKVSI